MTKNKDESDTLNEEVEILNLPLYTERKADGIYRYRRRVPKSLTKRVGKGYLYRNLGRAKDEVVANWPAAHTEIEQIIQAAQQGAENAQELVRKRDHRTMVLHLVEEHFGKQTVELLEAGKVDDDLEHALMDLSDSLEGPYPRKTLAMMYGGVLPEKQNTLAEVLDVYLEYKETGYAATDHRLRVRLDKCKADLIEALGSAKVEKLSVKDIKRQDANAYRDLLLSRMSANSVARYKNTINAAMNWYIKENALDMLSPFAGLLIKGAGASKTDRLPLTDEHLKQLTPQFEDSDAAWALYVTLRDTGARVAEVAGLRIKDYNVEQGSIHICPTPWRRLKNKSSQRSIPLSKESMAALLKVSQDRGPEDPVFVRYAKERGMDNCSQMLMKRLRRVIKDKKLTMHSLRHRMKDKLRNTGCPEAISMAILGHSANTVAANYGSGYALQVMREHVERVWGT